MSNLTEVLKNQFGKSIAECSNEEVYVGLLKLTKDLIQKKGYNEGKKKVYYISAEFLIGKLLSNNLINLGIYDEISKELAENNKNLSVIEECELEPSLGNGGLGRLAACFIDSIATLGMNGAGVSLNYHLGLFKQVFENKLQKETPNEWITDNCWSTRVDGVSYEVPFKDFTLKSTLYDIDVSGYDSKAIKLHLFDVDTIDESIVHDGIKFNQHDIAKNLTLFIYPDDSTRDGQLLRIYQQYFMVSNGAQLAIDEAKERGMKDLRELDNYVTIQINDTHPSMVIPELIRLMTAEGLTMDESIAVVKKVCAYTNHTILAEALEKWPIDYLEEVVPHLLPIIKELDERVKEEYKDKSVAIIDEKNLVHMAHMDIHYSYSVNGVAYLHTEILKNSELNNFYKIYPEKFNNKTNGITFRRWLMYCNHDLTKFIEDKIGSGFKKNAEELENLLKFADDDAALEELLAIKKHAKLVLKDFVQANVGQTLDENAIFDIQVKRLHEYKRQQLNILYIIYKYLQIKKEGKKPQTPINFIFGAKAAPAYVTAKDIIHVILCLEELINKDPEVNPYIKIVMVENYNVTAGEKLFPACDISEQISLASKEASGTGNMKFMLNGAVTLGTDDGANVEIHELVGDENIYIFGESSDQVIEHYEKRDYVSKDYIEKDPQIKELVEFLISDELMQIGNKENLERLYNELVNKDWFMTLLDLKDYIKVKDQAFTDYADRKSWAKKMLVNIAKAGFFSSDRTIKQYNEDIWKIQ